ncbi:hypothetical protein [Alicyclobacillus shizuokensis]|uniref:hypothetical protein n=1 Tax=Alicyclobacillus shizuokensis TaxID=392014 RepID=UPI000A759C2C|nr:hypothetical protein [Alicyclobacillus shizuokensis]MCL6625421.1 hypothetical protein [Alicyclobacillus shizuokensis]
MPKRQNLDERPHQNPPLRPTENIRWWLEAILDSEEADPLQATRSLRATLSRD